MRIPSGRGFGLTRNSFVLVTDTALLNNPDNGLFGRLADGRTYDIRNQLYRLVPGTTIPSGSLQENRPDYEQTYDGLELNFTKRLSNKWMARLNAGFQDWKQKNGAAGCVDPNNVLSTAFGANCPGDDIVARRSAGSGDFQNVFINSRWQVNINGLYELPWNFQVGGNLFAREGYPYVQYAVTSTGDTLGSRSIIIGKLDDNRYEDVYNLDLRLAKVVNVGVLQVTLSADIFNLLNADTVLQRQGRVNVVDPPSPAPPAFPKYNDVTEVQSPRIWRFGARISF